MPSSLAAPAPISLASVFATLTASGLLGGVAVPPTPLPLLLTADFILPLLAAHPEMEEALLPHLPPGQRTHDDLVEVLRCPPLRQASNSLTTALASGAGASLMATFGLDPGASNSGDATERLVEAACKKGGADGAPPT